MGVIVRTPATPPVESGRGDGDLETRSVLTAKVKGGRVSGCWGPGSPVLFPCSPCPSSNRIREPPLPGVELGHGKDPNQG